MFAIIQSGGRQVKVTPGATVTVDHFTGQPGEQVVIEQVLLVGRDGGETVAGAPFVSGASVVGVVEGDVRGDKIRIFKKKRRKGFRKSRGHRSVYTRVQVKDIRF